MIVRISGHEEIRLQDIWISGYQAEGKIGGGHNACVGHEGNRIIGRLLTRTSAE
jgi:hypothetical protein